MNTVLCEMNDTAAQPAQALSKIEKLSLSGQLPSPKGVALAVMEICGRENVSTDAIARVVQTDPALAGRLLRLANSAAVAASRPVIAVPDAIARLGLSTVRQLAMGFSLVDQHRTGPCKGFDYERFWSHSLLMAVAMKALGAQARVGLPDELFACGLMARIGCLALATVHPVEYAEILGGCDGDTDPALVSLERQHLQADHNDFTAAVLSDCGVPKALAEPVYHHENPEASGFAEGSRPSQLTHLIYHARRLADMAVAPKAQRNAIVSELMLLGGKLGMDVDDLATLVDSVISQWHEWGELLKVPSAPLPPFAAMVSAPAPKADEQQTPSRMRVLLVASDPTTRQTMGSVLTSMAGSSVHSACNGREALAMALEVAPQIVVTDSMMPVMDGLEFCRALRATEWGQSMYVIMLTGVETEEEVVLAFEAGVDDYVTKPVNVRALHARMRAALHYVQLLDTWERDRTQLRQFAAELAISNRKLEHYALTDQLTGLPNRRAAMDVLSQAWSATSRTGHELAVMMVDIDSFKSVNDTYGHAVGDRVLAEVGRMIRESMRKHEHASRVGGEEFLIICQNAGPQSVVQAAERLRKEVSGARIRIDDVDLRASISIGVAYREPDTPDADRLMAAADRALYAAKERGRDRTCVSAGGELLDASG